MYYTVNFDTGLIMESSDTCPDPQEEANLFDVPVYIIKGEHTGLTASPKNTSSNPSELTLDERQARDQKALAAWNN